jgi:drug/metabolite transporter (DMT)-like permease
VSRRGWLLFASMCVIWGVPYLLIRVAVRDLSPAALVLSRTVIAAAVLLPLAARREELRPLRSHWRVLAVFAAIEIAIPWILLGRAEQHLSSSLTGLLVAAVPLVAVAVAATTGERERVSGARAFGLLLGVAGVAAIVGVNLDGASAAPLVEVGLVAVCYAVGPLILQRHLAHLPAMGVIAASLAVTALVYLPITAFSLPRHTPSTAAIASVVGLAVVCTALAFVVFFALIGEIGPVRATVITYVNPAVAAVLGVAVLGEHLTPVVLLGFALVLAGSVLATRAPKSGGALEPTSEPVRAAASS